MEDNILGLQISVDNLVFVHIVQSFKCLLKDIFGQRFGYFAFLFQKIVQLPWVAQFEHQVHVLSIAEKGVHLDNVWMLQETLDLYFPDNLDQKLLVDVLLIDSF